ncbi:hypothetical protein BDW72DRAFT_172482 [Aspergillus terricola var. indicus]
MPNVLVLGGSGYLGLAISQALLSSGNYTVWGSARTPEKAKLLLQNEISPIEVDITDQETLASTIAENSIDIVVETTMAFRQAGDILEGVKKAAGRRQDELRKQGYLGPKLGFVYCSGIWIHGSPSSRVSDLSPVTKEKAARIITWRPAHEQAILASRDVLDVAIIRPGIVYGRGSWIWSTWWAPILKAKRSGAGTEAIHIPADIGARPATVHVDDVAAGFHAAIDRVDGRLGSWPVFDLVTETVGVQDIVEAAKAGLGVEAPVEYTGPQGDVFMEAMSTVSNSDTGRARAVLGWEPKRSEFVLNMSVYVRAWEATQA